MDPVEPFGLLPPRLAPPRQPRYPGPSTPAGPSASALQ
jgi:hypothetical protein